MSPGLHISTSATGSLGLRSQPAGRITREIVLAFLTAALATPGCAPQVTTSESPVVSTAEPRGFESGIAPSHTAIERARQAERSPSPDQQAQTQWPDRNIYQSGHLWSGFSKTRVGKPVAAGAAKVGPTITKGAETMATAVGAGVDKLGPIGWLLRKVFTGPSPMRGGPPRPHPGKAVVPGADYATVGAAYDQRAAHRTMRVGAQTTEYTDKAAACIAVGRPRRYDPDLGHTIIDDRKAPIASEDLALLNRALAVCHTAVHDDEAPSGRVVGIYHEIRTRREIVAASACRAWVRVAERSQRADLALREAAEPCEIARGTERGAVAHARFVELIEQHPDFRSSTGTPDDRAHLQRAFKETRAELWAETIGDGLRTLQRQRKVEPYQAQSPATRQGAPCMHAYPRRYRLSPPTGDDLQCCWQHLRAECTPTRVYDDYGTRGRLGPLVVPGGCTRESWVEVDCPGAPSTDILENADPAVRDFILGR